MEEALQYKKTAQCFGLPTASPRGHRFDGNKAGHALTFKLDHSTGADQWHTHFANHNQDKYPEKTLDYMFFGQKLAIGDHYVRSTDTSEISDHLPIVAYVTLP